MKRPKDYSVHELQKYGTLLAKFDIPEGEITKIKIVKNGRINTTVVVSLLTKDGLKRYTLQKINVSVFNNPVALMENVARVTKHICAKGKSALNVNCVKNPVVSKYLYFDSKTNSYWRLYDYIEADVKNAVEDKKDMYMLGRAIGDYSRALNGFDVGSLFETIPDFHNTRKRYIHFCQTMDNDVISLEESRCVTCEEEIQFVYERAYKAILITEALEKGKIPLRVSHNDTKLNNVLFDKIKKEPLCLIDLDTVMPGTVLYDFGDAARYGCNTDSEDARTTEKVNFNLEYFNELTKGFLETMGDEITEEEVFMLVDSVWMMTFELAVRFLDDHIAGNLYFTVDYDGKNLERARVQMALLKDIEKKKKEMEESVYEIYSCI